MTLDDALSIARRDYDGVPTSYTSVGTDMGVAHGVQMRATHGYPYWLVFTETEGEPYEFMEAEDLPQQMQEASWVPAAVCGNG